jgi:hypothetical protein
METSIARFRLQNRANSASRASAGIALLNANFCLALKSCCYAIFALQYI